VAGFERALVLTLAFGLPSLWATGPEANRKGNAAFKRGEFVRARSHYGKAQESLPGERIIPYNSGTALLAEKKYPDAIRSLLAALGDPRRVVKSRASYNTGNALFESNQHPEALSAYRQAILADPSDLDAKFNYELTRRRIQTQEQEQGKDGEGKDSKEQKESQDESSKSQEDRQQKKEQEKQEQQSAQNSEQNAQENPSQPPPQPGEEEKNAAEQEKPQPAALLTKEQAEQLLQALEQSEVEMLKARLKSKRKKNVDKDW
jgi:Ca-activated chloride channel family protein